MTRRKKIYIGLAGLAGLLLVFLLALNYLASTFINLESVKIRLQSTISQKVGGEVAYRAIDLSIFPFPHVVIHQGILSIPGIASGSMGSASFYPEILPLLTGTVQFSEIRITGPDIKIILPQKTGDKHKKEKSDKHILDRVKDQGSLLVAPLALDAPDLVVVMEKGSVNLLEENKPVFSFEDIDSRIVISPSGLKVNVTCSSSLWEKVTLRITLDPKHFRGKGNINLDNFKPETLREYLFPDDARHRPKSIDDLTIRFETDGMRNLQAKVQGSHLMYVYQYLDKKTIIKSKSFKATMDMDSDKTIIVLSELQLDYPRMNLSGDLSVDRTAQQISLKLKGKNVDVQSLREAAHAFKGDIPVTGKIFNIVKGGTIPEITFHSKSRTFADLDSTENFIVNGRMQRGKIFAPGPDLNLEDVKGEIVISKGILKGKHLEARLENSKGREGTLTIGLKGDDAPFHLDLLVKTELTQLPPLLKRLVKNETFVNEITRTYNVKGSAEGRLVLGDSLKSVTARVDISEMDLSADYERFPYPLKIEGGQFSYNAQGISVKNMSGGLGKSSFSGFTALLDLDKDYRLQIRSGKGRVDMDEIYPWLTSFEKIRHGLKEFRSVHGVMGILSLHLEGPLLKPGDWQFEGKGDVTSVEIDTTLIPDPIEVTKGKYEINKVKLSLMNNQMNVLDASFHVSGSIGRYREGLHNAELTFRGKMGPGATEWLSNLINLPTQLRVRSPLSVSQANLIYEKNVRTVLKGNVTVRKSPEVSIDLALDKDKLALNNLSVRDDESHSSASLVLKEKEVSLHFDGNITRKTLDDIYLTALLDQEWIKGNFAARILTDDPINSSAKGRLEGKNIIFPWKLKVPLTINSFILDASNNKVNVKSGNFTLGDTRLYTQGDIKFTSDGYLVDMDVSSDGVDWKNIGSIFESEKDVLKKDTFWDLPVLGNLNFKSETFSYGRFTWKPFRAHISFDRDTIDVAVTDTSLCGISTPGVLKVTPQDLSLDFQPVARNQKLEPTVACLFDISRYMTGRYDLEGKVRSSGKTEDLSKSVNGTIDLSAKDGRIYQYGITSKVFAFLNLTEIFRGRTPDFIKEGFAYESITAKADIHGSNISLKEFVIDGSSMEIAAQGEVNLGDNSVDLLILVAPLKTADFVLRKIPLVKGITGDTIVTIPVKVTGDFKNPKITYTSPSVIGQGLMGIMKDTLKSPLKIIEPVVPANGEKSRN